MSVGSRTRVVVATVTYGDRSDTCIRVVERALECGADAALIVDNGSEPGSGERLREFAAGRPQVEVHSLPENGGSAVGFAAALELARRAAADRVWLLDDDNLPAPDALRVALTTADDQGPAAAIACFRRADPLQVAVVEGGAVEDTVQIPGAFLGFDLARRLRPPRSRGGRRTTAVELPWAPYGGLLLPMHAVREVDLPVAGFVLYGDDRDYSDRFRRSGGTIWLEPLAVIDDIVARWDGGTVSSAPVSNLDRMIRSGDRRRAYYLLRNTAFEDRRLATRRGVRLRFTVNLAVFVAVATAKAWRARRPGFVPLLLRALRDGFRADWYDLGG